MSTEAENDYRTRQKAGVDKVIGSFYRLADTEATFSFVRKTEHLLRLVAEEAFAAGWNAKVEAVKDHLIASGGFRFR
jgi:hypothetical protein